MTSSKNLTKRIADINRPIHYYVEGECEAKLINALKTGKDNFIRPGKVEVFNVIRDRISKFRIAALKRNTIIVLVYDVDVRIVNIPDENIRLLKSAGFSYIHHIQSLDCFEDEIVYSSSLNDINDCFKTERVDGFKARFIEHKDILTKLKSIEFDPKKMWSRVNQKSPFALYSRQSSLDFIHQF